MFRSELTPKRNSSYSTVSQEEADFRAAALDDNGCTGCRWCVDCMGCSDCTDCTDCDDQTSVDNVVGGE